MKRLITTILSWPLVKYPLYILVISIFIYFLMDWFLMPLYTRHGQAIEVPDVSQMTYEGARTLLRQRGLEIVEKEKKFDIHYRAGVVISQYPEPGSPVKKGRRVYVIVSKGEPTVEMPKVIGESEQNAIFKLNQIGLKVRHVSYEHSEHFPEGVVIDQSAKIGEEVKLGDFVDLYVSLGKFPDQFIVPDLIGHSLDDAKKIIQKAGLTLGIVTYREEAELLPETVIEQSIEANTQVSQGEAVHIVVSKLPETAREINR